MILLWVLLGVDVTLVLWIALCYLRHPISRREDPAFLLIPAGEALEKLLGQRTAGKEPSRLRDDVYRILVETSGREAGERLYHRYRCRRWGTIIGALTLILTLYLVSEFLHMDRDGTALKELSRPLHGEGDRKSSVILSIEGEDESTEMMLVVPEQSLSGEEKDAKVSEALQALSDAVNGRVFTGDLQLPQRIGEVQIRYQSLSPGTITNDGEWQGVCGEERVEAFLRASATLEEAKEECVLTFFRAAVSELSEKERKEQQLQGIREAIVIGDETLILPEKTEDGARIRWEKSETDDSFLWALLLVLVPLLLYFKEAADYRHMADRRLAAIRNSYPEFLGELVILIGAGLSLMSAWKRIGGDYRAESARSGRKDALLDEVEKTAREMEEGSSMREALEAFSARIPLREIRRFVSLLIQNLKRGDEYLLVRLREMSEEAWETRKKQVREKSEEADTKLLLPLMMMLVVVLIIVLSPALITMNL